MAVLKLPLALFTSATEPTAVFWTPSPLKLSAVRSDGCVVAGNIEGECRITNSCVIQSGGVEVQGVPAKGAIGIASVIVEERISAKATIIVSCGIMKERGSSERRVLRPRPGVWVSIVGIERGNAGGRVKIARSVAKERLHAVGRVEIAGGIAEEGTDTGSRVLMTIGVGEEGAESLCGVGVAGIVMKERLKAKSGVVDSTGQA